LQVRVEATEITALFSGCGGIGVGSELPESPCDEHKASIFGTSAVVTIVAMVAVVDLAAVSCAVMSSRP